MTIWYKFGIFILPIIFYIFLEFVLILWVFKSFLCNQLHLILLIKTHLSERWEIHVSANSVLTPSIGLYNKRAHFSMDGEKNERWLGFHCTYIYLIFIFLFLYLLFVAHLFHVPSWYWTYPNHKILCNYICKRHNILGFKPNSRSILDSFISLSLKPSSVLLAKSRLL